MNKLYQLNKLVQIIGNLKHDKKRIGFTNGCYDLLHPGHIYNLAKSRLLCDFLIVGLNSDSSVKKLKGKDRPIESQQLRISKLSSLIDVDAIVVFFDESPLKLIKLIMPDILIKGSDYKGKEVIGSNFVIEKGGSVEFIDILEDYSTSKIINDMKNIKT